MPMSKTKELAKKLGLLKKQKAEENTNAHNSKRRRKGQLLSFVIVIDFESTCWKDKKGAQEIIEFPAVLLDLQTGNIIDEFQQYVQPQECPTLSEFCKDLTGISQAQVDNGVPLPTCLYLFGKWVKVLHEKKGVVLMEPGQQYSSIDTNLCALATWSDWDLGVCLHYECRRKQIRKPSYFDHWIDLRIVYKQFYDRKPAGLCGSLEDLGIPFTGREHCGLDDARNTAKLCFRLVKDGCKLTITKSLLKKRPAPVLRVPIDHGKEHQTQKTMMQCENRTATTVQPKSLIPSEPRNEKESIGTNPDSCSTEEEKEQEEWTHPNDESFLNDIVHEFEQLEKNDYKCQVSMSTTSTCDQQHTSVSFTQANSKPRIQTQNGVATPSRLHVLTHITPVTLLPSAQNNTAPHCARGNSSQNQPYNVATAPHCTRDNSSLNQPHTVAIETKSCSSTITSSSTPTSDVIEHKQASSSHTSHTHDSRAIKTVSPTPLVTSTDDFLTPSTMQWMKVKSSRSTSPSILSYESPQPFNGGKITPPLCNCGKRAKRKLVTSPGPNQGKPFFSCPGGRESGCQYFKWENSSPLGQITKSIVNLTSEYD